jgi:hypothetical protein
MSNWDFCTESLVVVNKPPDASGTSINMNGWNFGAKPTDPWQYTFSVTIYGLRWYTFSNGGIDDATDPYHNARRFEEFIKEHGTWKSFDFPHPQLGTVEARFKALPVVPPAAKEANGVIEAFDMELVHHQPDYDFVPTVPVPAPPPPPPPSAAALFVENYATRAALKIRAHPIVRDTYAISEPGFEGDFVADVAADWTTEIAADDEEKDFFVSTADSTVVFRRVTGSVAERIGYATYAELAAITDKPAGTVGEVPTTDTGTHTDPVVGGTKNNSGVFRWSSTPAGWQRISDVDALSAAPYATAAAASAAAAAAAAAILAGKFVSVTPPGFKFAICDGNGAVAFGIKDDGTVQVGVLDAGTVISASGTISDLLSYFISGVPSGYKWAVVDSNNAAALGIKNDGTVVAGALEADTLNGIPTSSLAVGSGVDTSDRFFPADVTHIFAYGQSLSVGTDSNPAISTTQRFDNLMFNGGVRNAADGGGLTSRTSFVPLVESNATSISGGPAGETPMAGCTEAIKELMLSENGLHTSDLSFQLLGSSAGFPAVPIATLAHGTTAYTNMLADITAGKTNSAALNKTYKCMAFIWMQGESDVTNTTYHTSFAQLVADINTDVKSITGQLEDVLCLSYGGQEADIVLQMQMAASAEPRIIIPAPMYIIEHVSGDVHLVANGEKVFGAYCGRAFKRSIIDGRPWVPLKPRSTFRQGKLAEIRFNVPHGPLVFDTTNYASQTTRGFRLFQADGTTPITISAVDITQPDTVRITAATTIPANAVLRYGMDNSATHDPIFGGNLRDSDPTVFDGGGMNVTLHNWCICFEEILA